MKAIMIIHEGDPQESFDIIEHMKARVNSVGGCWSCSEHWSDKFQANYFEYKFEAANCGLEVLL